MNTIAEDLAEAPGEKMIRIEVAPVLPCSCIIGGLSIDSRICNREAVRDQLHALVEEMLDKIYPPPPRKSTAEIEMDMAHEINMRLQKEGHPFL